MKGSDENPEFTVDNNGNIHCVWSHNYAPNFHKIHYSKSIDDGETWTEPLDLSQNEELWMGSPCIVSDSQSNLYVTYEYNVGSIYHISIYFMKYDGISWSEPCPILSDFGPIGPITPLIIDNNDRVYAFWFWGFQVGEVYYRYYEDGEWSEIICPYSNHEEGRYGFASGKSDSDNNLHFVGVYYNPQSGWGLYGDRTSYFHYDYQTDTWEEPIVLGIRYTQQGRDIDLDSNEYPHIVWRENVNDSIPPNDGTLYSYFDGENWSEPEILVEDPWYQVIAIDNNDYIHLVEKEKYGTGSGIVYNLVYYTNIDSIWEGTIIVESENVASLPQLEIYNNKIYLIYFNSSEPYESDIYFIKKDLSIPSIGEHYINNISAISLSQNYPNPFNPTTQIDFSLNKSGYTTLKIFNVKGELIRTLVDGYKRRGDYSVLWDGKNKDGKEVRSGIYLYRLQVENHCITRSLTLVK
jgi:hypothetical protein